MDYMEDKVVALKSTISNLFFCPFFLFAIAGDDL